MEGYTAVHDKDGLMMPYQQSATISVVTDREEMWQLALASSWQCAK